MESTDYENKSSHCQLEVQYTLEELLQAQEREREVAIEKSCLFCKRLITGVGWKKYLSHIQQAHQLRMGPPENLVFVPQFVGLLDSKLKSQICIYCSKTFKSDEILKQHMRKKKHLRIHPKNKEFDRFYISNYLDPQKSWEELQDEKDESFSEETWDDWQDELEQTCKCLFCAQTLPTVSESLCHCSAVHGFDLQRALESKGMCFELLGD